MLSLSRSFSFFRPSLYCSVFCRVLCLASRAILLSLLSSVFVCERVSLRESFLIPRGGGVYRLSSLSSFSFFF